MKLIKFIALIQLVAWVLSCNGQEVVVRLEGGETVARALAQEYSYFYKGKVKGFKDTYILVSVLRTHQKRTWSTKNLHEDARVVWAEPQTPRQRIKRDQLQPHLLFNDELWPQQWYLRNSRSKLDLNVLPVYEAGITGRNVRISILDDGLEYTHDDLKQNYDPLISWDCNDDDDDPLPRYDPQRTNSHGTRCAGEVAMTQNNEKCGVGVAFNARIGGIKLLDGIVTDRVEGMALSFAQDLVDIYSASWGPNDDGKTLDGPGTLALEALERGVLQGRQGKGALFVWASGNGGSNGDNCNCDGYIASIFTIAIGSASQRGSFPWYGEACAAILAVTASSGAHYDPMIATTDLFNKCTLNHTGTSASAPLAAGVLALALEVNPNLTWRDVQHLIVYSSQVEPLWDNPGWFQNAAGLYFNTRFGFGLMNAHFLVKLASSWRQVPEKTFCEIPSFAIQKISFQQPVLVKFQNLDSCPINYLEHVQLIANLNYTKRGALKIQLHSPLSTKVTILEPRRADFSTKGLENWTFMSVVTWGESPQGVWTLKLQDSTLNQSNYGSCGPFRLRLHGTALPPRTLTNQQH